MERVFSYFATADGLCLWWPATASADARIDGRYHFGFDAAHQWGGVVRIYDAPNAIEFEMTDTDPMPDWRGTRVGARLSREGDATRLHFYHRGWPAATAHHRISSFCWSQYLRVLARHATRGEFVPYERRDEL